MCIQHTTSSNQSSSRHQNNKVVKADRKRQHDRRITDAIRSLGRRRPQFHLILAPHVPRFPGQFPFPVPSTPILESDRLVSISTLTSTIDKCSARVLSQFHWLHWQDWIGSLEQDYHKPAARARTTRRPPFRLIFPIDAVVPPVPSSGRTCASLLRVTLT